MIIPIIVQPPIPVFSISILPVQTHPLHFHFRIPFYWGSTWHFDKDRLMSVPLYCQDILDLLPGLLVSLSGV